VVTALGASNVGSISPYAIRGLQDRGVTLPLTDRDPLQLIPEDLMSAEIVIVLDKHEHRPFMHLMFPDWADKVTYWHVGDLHVETIKEALNLAERNIKELIQHLTMQQR